MIVVNGSDVSWREGLDVASLLAQMNYTYVKIIVKINGAVVEPDDYAATLINDGDNVYVLHLLAGG